MAEISSTPALFLSKRRAIKILGGNQPEICKHHRGKVFSVQCKQKTLGVESIIHILIFYNQNLWNIFQINIDIIIIFYMIKVKKKSCFSKDWTSFVKVRR